MYLYKGFDGINNSRGKTSHILSESLVPGTYYIEVVPYNARGYDLNTAYDLKLSITEVEGVIGYQPTAVAPA